ncbi:synaptojanin [Dermatophagoides pteronyssinus]|uniref:synaptojanin n=1 Tax=Dermatophagoides pteronyssinus TaxID=6956 RepID=UPI003F67A1C1
MVLGKIFRIYHKTDKNNVYSVLLENKNDRSESLLFESGCIDILGTRENEAIKPLYHMLMDVYGCLGILNLNIGIDQQQNYLVCIVSCVSIGKIQNSEIFCITETTFIPLQHGHQQQQQSELDRIQDIKKILNSQTFYFSWTTPQQQQQLSAKKFDLTICCQRLERMNETDNRFFWNRMFYPYMKSFNVNTDRWLLKIMCGFVGINTVYVGHQQAKACLISRLSCERAGTRFNVRGCNDNGNVANFVETEQIILLDNNNISSYLIVRGSIPLFWEQTGVQVGSHKLRLSRGNELSHPAYERHLAMLQYLYGKQVIINLVSNKESEFILGSMYKTHHKLSYFSNDIPYIAFDYHHYCQRGQREENLVTMLKERVKKYFDEFGFYYSIGTGNDQDGGNENRMHQTGTFRINCIDCLDRTNRVQTFFGLEMLKQQLRILRLDEKSTIVSRFTEVFKNMWQSNGDQISRIYAGTGALEGKSKIRDGTLSVARTFQNNLFDSNKQEAFDILLTGKLSNIDYMEKFRSLLPNHYLHLPSPLLMSIYDRHFEYTNIMEIRVAVGTWNVNGGKHFNSIIYKKSDPLSDWLLDYNRKNQPLGNQINILDLSLDDSLSSLSKPDSPDLYAIGFEEIVDLSAQNIVATSTTNQKEWLMELEKTLSRNETYVLVTCVQLVGVCLFLFVKPKFARYIRDVQTDTVKTGFGGATGNKGGVGIRLRLYNSTLCFICSHFAAGQHQVQERNQDFKEISRKMFQSIGKKIKSHDYVFWCGDFNYRIDMPIDECKQLISEQKWSELLEKDQLKCQQQDGLIFHDYHEGQVDFAPTYKYDINSDDYDTSEKSRIPAWTDRILYRKFQPTSLMEKETNEYNYGEIVFYGRTELKTSDHRPVIGEYKIEILQSDFDRFNQVFNDVIEKSGPIDSTVIIKEINPMDPSKSFEPIYIEELIKKINEQICPIVLAGFGDDHMRITLKNGQSAIKLVQMGIFNVLDRKFQAEYKTKNWLELIQEQIDLGVCNTIPLIENTKKLDIDQIYNDNNYNFKKLITNQTDLDQQLIIDSILIDDQSINNQSNQQPVRPPPPKQSSLETGGKEKSVAPVRPAPPPPPATKKSSEKKIIDDIFDTCNNNDDDSPLSINEKLPPQLPPSRPPPIRITQQQTAQVPPPPPSMPNNVDHNDYDDYDDDSDDDNHFNYDNDDDDDETNMPNIPAPVHPACGPPPVAAPLLPAAAPPPPIPSRRLPPSIPPPPPPAIPPRGN